MSDQPNDIDAGGPQGSPASSRSSGVFWEVELWPQRSLSRAGQRSFLLMLAGFFAFFLMLTAAAPPVTFLEGAATRVFLVVTAFVIVTFLLVVAALARNRRQGDYRERVAIEDAQFIIEAHPPGKPTRRWEFEPYWTRVLTRLDRHGETELILRNADRAVAIGAFLTSDERRDLADEIERALRRFSGAHA